MNLDQAILDHFKLDKINLDQTIVSRFPDYSALIIIRHNEKN